MFGIRYLRSGEQKVVKTTKELVELFPDKIENYFASFKNLSSIVIIDENEGKVLIQKI